jgi:hypothetical protein
MKPETGHRAVATLCNYRKIPMVFLFSAANGVIHLVTDQEK